MGWACTSRLTGTVPELEVTGRGQTQGNSHGEGEGEKNIPAFCVPTSTQELSFSKQSCEYRVQRGTRTCKLVRVRI